jgi:hypothetical protein
MANSLPELIREATAKGYALVRGPDGKPKIDDPTNLHAETRQMLTPAERANLEGRK